MKKITLSAVAVLSLASGFTSTLSASDDFTLFSNAKVNGEVRPRYEYVDVEDSGKMNANAYTVRASIGLEASLFGIEGLSAKVDGTTVQTIGGTRYDNNPSASIGDSRYEIVADPDETRFTQGYLQYKLGATTAKVGRQLVNLDTQRFIGSVDWRQMPQSLDAVSITNTSVPGLNLYGAYVYSYDTVFKEPVYKSTSVILNANYKVNDMLKITVYDYMLSLEKSAFAADTYGLSFNGDVPAGPAKIGYRAEYAKQDDSTFKTTTTNVEVQNNAYYYDIEATVSMMGVTVGAGREFLSGTTDEGMGADGKTKFQTPLATLHKFNGTADKFLTTPTGGLVDTFASIGYSAKDLGNAMITYHDFKTDVAMSGKTDLGSELDMQYANAIPGLKGLSGLVKAAYYSGGDVATYVKDVTKVWVQASYKF